MTHNIWKIENKKDITTLLNFISERLNLSKNKGKALLDKRLVFVNHKRVWIASYQLQKGDVVEVTGAPCDTGLDRNVPILYEDAYYLIASKPPHILSNGADSLETVIQKKLSNKDIRAVHRLDKNTSGAIIFAKGREEFEKIKGLFLKKEVKKIYRALVRGRLHKKSFVISTPVEGKEASSHVRLLAGSDKGSYLEIEIDTGRTHQIRIHLASIGYPVIGEAEYDRHVIKDTAIRYVTRQMLHAYKISFLHPYTGDFISVTIEPPADFNQTLKILEL